MKHDLPKRCSWWSEAPTESAAAHELLKRIARVKAHGKSSWPRWLIACRHSAMRTAKQIDVTRAVMVLLADDEEKRLAFESAYRLNPRAAAKLVASWVTPPKVELTPEEKRAAMLGGVKRVVDKRENRARGMLHHHRVQLARALRQVESEKKLIAKWQARVAYYDKKRADSAAA